MVSLKSELRDLEPSPKSSPEATMSKLRATLARLQSGAQRLVDEFRTANELQGMADPALLMSQLRDMHKALDKYYQSPLARSDEATPRPLRRLCQSREASQLRSTLGLPPRTDKPISRSSTKISYPAATPPSRSIQPRRRSRS